MRQRDDIILFINALNNLASGPITEEDNKLIRSREVPDGTHTPPEAIYLFATNDAVNTHNDEKISDSSEREHVFTAEDSVICRASNAVKTRALDSMKTAKYSDMGGLPHTLRIKIKYMITSNIDIEDDIVNGACGTLKLITYNNNVIERLWLDFQPHDAVGIKAKNKYVHIINIIIIIIDSALSVILPLQRDDYKNCRKIISVACNVLVFV